MRSHFLRDLSIQGSKAVLRALPDFDFYNLRRVTSLNWSTIKLAPERRCAEFNLIASYEDSEHSVSLSVRVRCLDVKQLKLPEMGAEFFLAEIEIEDLSRDQMEGVR